MTKVYVLCLSYSKHPWFEIDLPSDMFKTQPVFSPYTDTQVDFKAVSEFAQVNALLGGAYYEMFITEA